MQKRSMGATRKIGGRSRSDSSFHDCWEAIHRSRPEAERASGSRCREGDLSFHHRQHEWAGEKGLPSESDL